MSLQPARGQPLARYIVGIATVVLLASLVPPIGASPTTAPGAPLHVAGVATTPATAPCAGTWCATTHPALPSPAATRARPALLGNTPSNWLVANWSGEGEIAENPANPMNMVAGSLYQAPSALNNTTIYNNQGVSGVFTSFDGGHYWQVSPLPACEFHIADTSVGFGPNNHVYYSDMGWTTGQTGCTYSTSGYGVFVTTSTDGGVTWGQPVPVRGNSSTSLDKDWLTVDQNTGEIYVGYTDDGVNSQIYVQNSTDNGTRWSAPVDVSQGTDSMRGVELVVDASGALDAAWVDQGNGELMFARSVNHGHTFSTPKVVATASVYGGYYSSPSPDGFRAYILPGLGIDNYSGNPYTGRLYMTWQNGTGGTAGSPVVSFTYSDDNGTTWTAPITVNSDTKYEDFQPSVAADPAGTVYVVWYAENATNGHYRLLGAVSHNGGSSFDPEINISDTDSYPYYSGLGYAWWIGDYTSTIADAGGAHTLWTDARGTEEWSCNPCLWGYDYNISMYTAQIVNFTVGSNVAVNLTVTGTVTHNASWTVTPAGTAADWLVGENFTLSAPFQTDSGGTPMYFAAWYGAVDTASPNLTGTVNASGEEWACYVPVPGGTCHAAGAPGFLNVTVVPANATVRINSRPVVVSGGQQNFSMYPGQYWVNVSAPGFHSFSTLADVSTANVTRVVANLSPYPGTIAGTVEPVTAIVQVDGTRVAVAPNGSFSADELPGLHEVTASQSLYSYFSTNLSVRTNTTSTVSPTLFAQWGVLAGSVDPAGAAVTVNGAAVSTTNGSFTLELRPGVYWVNASLAGYVDASSGPVGVALLATTTVALGLVLAMGNIAGTLTPASADLELNGSPVAVSGGSFNVSARPGTYWLNASALGYTPNDQLVTVNPEEVYTVEVSLTLSPGWIAGSVSPVGATVLVDGAAITVNASGQFNVSETAGNHLVSAHAPGKAASSQTVRVLAGYTLRVQLVLNDVSPSSVSSSWVWPIAGLLGAVAVAAAVVVLWVARRRRRRPLSERGG